jgi:hypothetical protein
VQNQEALAVAVCALALTLAGWRALGSFERALSLLLTALVFRSARHATQLGFFMIAVLPAAADAALGAHSRFADSGGMRRVVRWLLPIAALAFAPALVLHETYDERRVYSQALLVRFAASGDRQRSRRRSASRPLALVSTFARRAGRPRLP